MYVYFHCKNIKKRSFCSSKFKYAPFNLDIISRKMKDYIIDQDFMSRLFCINILIWQ